MRFKLEKNSGYISYADYPCNGSNSKHEIHMKIISEYEICRIREIKTNIGKNLTQTRITICTELKNEYESCSKENKK